VTDPDLRHVSASALPAIDQLCDTAAGRLAATGPAIVCAHIAERAATGEAAVVCAQHPGAGLLCPACAEAHTGRHADEDEHRCDACGTVVAVLWPLIGQRTIAVPTLTTASAPGLYLGPVLIVSVGICRPCGVAAGLDLEVVA
jgi:hypothetical protein